MTVKQSVTIDNEKQMPSIGRTIRGMLLNGKVKVTLQHPTNNRSLAQNNLMWIWHGELAKKILEVMGETYSSDDIHEYVADKLLPKRVITVLNEPMIERGKTSKLGVKGFTEFLQHYEGWALTTYECQFSRPDDWYYEAMGFIR